MMGIGFKLLVSLRSYLWLRVDRPRPLTLSTSDPRSL
jgi:hypothetical protein